MAENDFKLRGWSGVLTQFSVGGGENLFSTPIIKDGWARGQQTENKVNFALHLGTGLIWDVNKKLSMTLNLFGELGISPTSKGRVMEDIDFDPGNLYSGGGGFSLTFDRALKKDFSLLAGLELGARIYWAKGVDMAGYGPNTDIVIPSFFGGIKAGACWKGACVGGYMRLAGNHRKEIPPLTEVSLFQVVVLSVFHLEPQKKAIKLQKRTIKL